MSEAAGEEEESSSFVNVCPLLALLRLRAVAGGVESPLLPRLPRGEGRLRDRRDVRVTDRIHLGAASLVRLTQSERPTETFLLVFCHRLLGRGRVGPVVLEFQAAVSYGSCVSARPASEEEEVDDGAEVDCSDDVDGWRRRGGEAE